MFITSGHQYTSDKGAGLHELSDFYSEKTKHRLESVKEIISFTENKYFNLPLIMS